MLLLPLLKKAVEVPVFPARPVRPIRWVYSEMSLGKS